jgi:predicted nucleotidyltransferase component of viral defense system
MGKSSTQARANGFRIYYHFLPESDPTTPKRIKIEINTREHFTVYGAVPANYSVDNRWYSGGAEISTYSIDELAGTKLRALYQRKKGRDLFDIDRLIGEQMIDHGETVKAFQLYLDHQNLRVTQKQFAANLTEKLTDTTFREDVDSLLVSGTDYDADKAYINTMQLVEIIP